jgi:transglutaminase-like putative cysteine protease
MPSARTINEVVDQVIAGAGTERLKAIAAHDYVREHVKFGFNRYFDATEPDYTLSFGYGHCNPKSRLMVELFRAIGLESHQHFVVIPRDILDGTIPAFMYWMVPTEICHSFVEVEVMGTWYQLDSYIVDTPLLKAAQARLAQANRRVGYGACVDSTNVWDGQSNTFSQFEPSLMIEDHGCVDDLRAYFRSQKYRHRFLGIPFNTIFPLMGTWGVAPINAQIERIRRGIH